MKYLVDIEIPFFSGFQSIGIFFSHIEKPGDSSCFMGSGEYEDLRG
jgi:hypothetical protein